jgi:hypothetical protein
MSRRAVISLMISNAITLMIACAIVVAALVAYDNTLTKLKHTTQQIQQSRIQVTLENCYDTNRRHKASDDYLSNLDKTLNKANPSKTAANNAGLAEFKTLIQALVPKRNCVTYAQQVILGSKANSRAATKNSTNSGTATKSTTTTTSTTSTRKRKTP